MYNLIMSSGVTDWDTGEGEMPNDRYLEWTLKPIAEKFASLDDEVIKQLKGFPALFAYEKAANRAARLGWVSEIKRRQSTLWFRFAFDERANPISPDHFLRLASSLDVDKFEINRHHWALKDVDLIDVLERNGLFHPDKARQPKLSRFTIAKAAVILRVLSHNEIDQLISDWNLNDKAGGRDLGGRQSRMLSVVKFVLANPYHTTLEGGFLADALVEQAAMVDLQYEDRPLPDVPDADRKMFWRKLEVDGFQLVKGKLVAFHPDIRTPAEEPQYMGKQEKREGPANIFIVHGRATPQKNEVALFLRTIGLEPVILHEQPNAGRTLISKFREVADGVAFAIVLMTPDDQGSLQGADKLNARARQNVIFELGFFIGKIGPEKVCALVSGNIEKPSDFEAVVYIEHDERGAWKVQLARELREAKVEFDANKVF